MPRLLVAAVAALACGASLAAAQSTTTTLASSTSTTLVASTSTTVLVTTTSTSVPATTSTSTTSTTSTSSTIPFKDYDPKACSRESSSKEECRQTCCSDDFDTLVQNCDGDACGTDWSQFLDQWRRAGDFFKFCQNPEDSTFDFDVSDIGKKYQQYNADNSCQAYRFGCKKVARKYVRQCADSGRCVACCRTVLRRWRAQAAKQVQKGSLGSSCRKAVACVRRATRKIGACRNACRRTPTCGAEQVHLCLASTPGGRSVLACYKKCSDKCGNRDAYKWCIQACQGLDDCNAFDTCSDASGGGGRCLARESTACVAITTTTTSTSSSTSSTSRSTTSTSSSTSSTSPL